MNWKIGAAGLAMLAGTASGQEIGPVVITEIMYNPSGVDEGQEWVEIYNPTGAAVDISRWYLEDDDGQTSDIPSGTVLGAGEIAVIVPRRGGVDGNGTQRRSTYVNSQAAWNAAWGPGIRVIFVESFWNYPGDLIPEVGTLDGLSNAPSTTNELLTLKERTGLVVDEVSYDDDEGAETVWPDDNDSGSIQLLREFTGSVLQNNSGHAWKLSRASDVLGSFHAVPGTVAFSGLESYGTPGRLPVATSSDCNANGIGDALELVQGLAPDAYPFNNIPDGCEADCNFNGMGDATEILLDWALDRDLDGQLDRCEINAGGGAGGIGGSLDTNANGVLDSFESKPNVVITEIMYNPAGDDTGKEYVEISNEGTTPVNLSGWRLMDLDDHAASSTLAPGTVIAPGEVIVLIPGGGAGVPSNIVAQFRQAWELPASVRVIGLSTWEEQAQQATSLHEILSLIDGVGEPVDVVHYENPAFQSGSVWPADTANASVYVRSGSLTKTANDLGTAWAHSLAGIDGAHDSVQTPHFSDSRLTGSSGSPGVVWRGVPQQASGEAVITELMYNPNSSTGDVTSAEWIEVFNLGPTDLDVSGWHLRDEDGRTGGIATGSVLRAGQLMILMPRGIHADSPLAEAAFRAGWGDICRVFAVDGWSDLEAVPNVGGLANSPGRGNEVLTLRRADGGLVDEVEYDDDGIIWPLDATAAAPGLGAGWSIALSPSHLSAVDNDIGQNWTASNFGIEGAVLNTLTLAYNGLDIGSPGFIEGVAGVECNPPACPWQSDGCYADYDSNGGIDGDDVIAFFTEWDLSSNCADVDGSQGVDGDDIILFFSVWDAGGVGTPGC